VWKRHLGVTSADAILGSYPRSGGTWLAIMLAEYLTETTHDLRSGDDAVPMVGEGQPQVALTPGGHLLRSHEPYRAAYHRTILLVRDPRDVAVSYYHFQHDRMKIFDGTLEQFVELYAAGGVDHYGAWHHHVASWLDGGSEQVLVRYADLRAQPEEELARALAFLGVEPDAVALAAVVASNSLGSMRSKEERSEEAPAPGAPVEARFVRDGAVGGWAKSLDRRSIDLIEETMGETMARAGFAPS
jgi:hypothetical protein